MPLKKVLLKPGVNRENTRYTTEGGWYDCDKIRFRQGTPEKIGGWERISSNTFLGICRSLWNWITLGYQNLLGVGTNLKFYIEDGYVYNDITPVRTSTTLTDPFETFNGSTTVEVTDLVSGYSDGDFVTFYGSTAVGGLTILGEFQITVIGTGAYTIDFGSAATSDAVGGGTVYAIYQINVGSALAIPFSGWGGGTWGSGSWGSSETSNTSIRIWSQSNFGEDLIFGPKGGKIYYWDATLGLTNRPVSLTIASPCEATTDVSVADGTPIRIVSTGSLPTGLTIGTRYYAVNSTGTTFNLAATVGGVPINTSGVQSGSHSILARAEALSDWSNSGAPTIQNYLLVSDINRFVFAFGPNDLGTVAQDPMLIRWSDQEDPFNWSPAATNQAGSLRLSRGSEIITATQARQEVLVWTDAALYSLQYIGAPAVWGAQLVGETISIVSQNAVAYANGVAYWMGIDKFYKYDGRTQTLNCDIRQYIFNDIDVQQFSQIFAGVNEAFNEVWWFYCSSDSVNIDKYAVYNYLENIWYYGTLGRTAWIDSGLRQYPLAATYANNIVNHESGNDNNETGTPTAIESYITSSEFDLDDGHQFAFIWRVLPDITFRGSTGETPAVTMYLLPLTNSGSGYLDPSSATINRTATVPIEQFTGQVYTRVRGRQLAMKIESTELGVAWQLGAPRLDMRTDGRR